MMQSPGSVVSVRECTWRGGRYATPAVSEVWGGGVVQKHCTYIYNWKSRGWILTGVVGGGGGWLQFAWNSNTVVQGGGGGMQKLHECIQGVLWRAGKGWKRICIFFIPYSSKCRYRLCTYIQNNCSLHSGNFPSFNLLCTSTPYDFCPLSCFPLHYDTFKKYSDECFKMQRGSKEVWPTYKHPCFFKVGHWKYLERLLNVLEVHLIQCRKTYQHVQWYKDVEGRLYSQF